MTSTKVCCQELISEIKSEISGSDLVKYKHIWTLRNFSSSNEAMSKFIVSQIFTSCSFYDFQSVLKWRMRFYPDGADDVNKGYFSIFLGSLNDSVESVNCEFKISSSTKVYHTRSCRKPHKLHKNETIGFKRFYNAHDILTDLKKGDGTLILICTMFFHKTFESKNSQLNLIKKFGSLLEIGKYSDVILISNDGSHHKAHKAILMCRSPVFSAMFQHNMQESIDNTVKIEDLDNEILRGILYFIYTGGVKNMEENAKQLLVAADKYDLDDLKKMCINYLLEIIKIDNTLELIEYAHTYNFNELKLKTEEFFLKNHKEIILLKGRENIKDISPYIMEKLFYDLATNDQESK